ncbi:hypothetical protein Dda_5168 [Drechslerella dactyloides]|uniref:Uncharacterized protein n=1 Tax=Drechslerella dactyloides TaxID=74499 RepID=A0AAD6IZT4_DREDA|nr:hypothetical protein Dda_5168 [Drechslerella dactyloides]
MPSLSRAARIAAILALTDLVGAETLFFPAFEAAAPADNLFRRQNNGNCPANTNSCASISYPGFCCINTAHCALDNAGHIACCPNGIVCSGTVAQQDGRCNNGYYACPSSLYSGGCCLSGYEFCAKNRCIGASDGIASVVAAVPGLVISAAGNGVGVYRTVTSSGGAIATSFVGDAGAVYSSYIANPAGAAGSWLGSLYTAASTAVTGFPIPTIEPSLINSVTSAGGSAYSDFRSDLGAWYTSFTSQFGSGYTSFLNGAGQYVTTIDTIVNGIATQTAVTVQFPAFVQAQPTGNVGVRSARIFGIGGDGASSRGGMVFLWVWTVGLGVFTAVVGWL